MKNGLVVLYIFGVVAVIIDVNCGKNDSQNGNKSYSDVMLSVDVKKEDLSSSTKIIDECPNGDECSEDAVCEKGENLLIPGIKSICTKPCPHGILEQDPEFKPDTDKIVCDDLGFAGCCGKVVMNKSNEIETWCLPAENCCDSGFSIMCGEECCTVDSICHETKNICVAKPECYPTETVCKYTCCFEHMKCAENEESCELKCQPPTPVYCKNECCANNYTCECEEQGGFCLPGDAMICDCADKSWCEPQSECILNDGCHADGKICKPLGGVDCTEAEECFCNPGQICTHESPACCPSDNTVPCGGYCCPAENECLADIQDCLPKGWAYCEKWGTKCGVGQDCQEDEVGCKDNQAEECDYDGIICSATENCVGEGKGIDGCCPTNQEVPCDGYCCPGGTHCDPGCDGCVQGGYQCCPDGQTICLGTKICWSGGIGCLDTIEQDCGSYMCDPNYVCSSGPQQCCPASTPQTCWEICCQSYDTCYKDKADNGGFCVDEQADEEYCGNSFKCVSGKKCGPNNKCIPDNAQVCSTFEYCDNMQCCQPCVACNVKCVAKGLDCIELGYCPPGSESRSKLNSCLLPWFWWLDGFPVYHVCCLLGSPISECGCDDEYQISAISYEQMPDASYF